MRNIIFIFSFTALMASCQQEEFTPEEAFLQIYDDENYNASYQPVALGNSDSNIFILSERNLDVSNFSGINLIITDLSGTFKSEQQLDEQFVAPTKDLLKIGDKHYFFCMDRSTLRPHLVSVSSAGALSFTPLNLNASYPLAAAINTGNRLIFLSYNQNDRNSVISIIGTDGQLQDEAEYTIGAGNDVLEAIIKHFTRPDRKLPFFCGQAPNGSYYFNGFYNFTLSLVFTGLGDDPTGVIQGQGTDAAMKYLLPIGGNNYAFMAFQFSDHFLSGSTELSSNEVTSSVNYFERKVPEIAPDAYGKIVNYSFGTDELTIMAAETEGRQVILYFFDKITGDLKNTYLLGTLNPFTFSDIKVFADGGIAITGTTFLADRFERVYLRKISRNQLIDII